MTVAKKKKEALSVDERLKIAETKILSLMSDNKKLLAANKKIMAAFAKSDEKFGNMCRVWARDAADIDRRCNQFDRIDGTLEEVVAVTLAHSAAFEAMREKLE